MADKAVDRRKAPPGITTFIVADIANFALFFGYFMVERMGQPVLFSRSAAMLDIRLGLLNTLILLTSGWLVALGVRAAQTGKNVEARRLLFYAVGVGIWFGVLKAFEYAAKIGHGLTPQTNAFFQFYYVFTGVHLLHYLIGLALLVAAIVRLRRPSHASVQWLEGCALFWHMVDLLWLFLFAMLYLQGAS